MFGRDLALAAWSGTGMVPSTFSVRVPAEKARTIEVSEPPSGSFRKGKPEGAVMLAVKLGVDPGCQLPEN